MLYGYSIYLIISVAVFDPPGLAAARSGNARVHGPRCFLDDHKYRPPPLCSSLFPLRPFPTFRRPLPSSSLGRIHAPLDPSHPGVPGPFGPFGLAAAKDCDGFNPRPATKPSSHRAVRCSRGSNIVLVLMIAVGSSSRHNGEMDALARSAGVQNAVCSKALSSISRPLALVFEPSSPVLHIRASWDAASSQYEYRIPCKASEIATGKIYEAMHIHMQQEPMAEMPRIDGDGIPPCCAASCLTYYAVLVSAYTRWNEVCVRSVVGKATEIATAKVYEVMHVNMQQRPMAKMPRSDGDGFCLVLSHRLRRAGQPACRMRLGVCLQHRQLPLSETSGLISTRRSSRGLVDYSRLCRLSSLVKEAATRRADICLRGCDRLDRWSFC